MLIQNRQKNNYFGIFRVIFIAVVFFVVASIGVVRDGVTQVLFSIAAPFWRAEQSVYEGADGKMPFLQSKQALSAANRALEERNRFLFSELSMAAVFKKENQELKEILDRREPEKEFILARVLAQPNRSPYDTLIVDKGEKDGVRGGDSVIAYGNAAIGTVLRVYAASSVVTLFSSPGNEIDAFLAEGNIPIVAKGVGGGNFTARAPKGVAVAEGDALISPALDPPLIGIVGRVESAPSDAFQNIFFQTPVNIYELKWVEILLGSGQGIEERENVSQK